MQFVIQVFVVFSSLKLCIFYINPLFRFLFTFAAHSCRIVFQCHFCLISFLIYFDSISLKSLFGDK